MDKIFDYSDDITYEILKFLGELSLFRLALTSKKFRNKIEAYYTANRNSKSFKLIQMRVSINFYDSFCRITMLYPDITLCKIWDVSKNKKKHKARDRMFTEFRMLFFGNVILPTLYHPIIDGIMDSYLYRRMLYYGY